jgi:methylthioribose-1-phosphate isomerase
MSDGVAEIPIEQRSGDEVAWISGMTDEGRVARVRLVPDNAPVANYAFDVTPARLVTGLITERGVIDATREAIARTFSERAVSC